MKTRNLFLGLLSILVISIYSCDSDPCDEGYTEVEQNGSKFCLPDYIVGIERSAEFGYKFYHNKYGIIEFVDGKWKNEVGENITELINVEN